MKLFSWNVNGLRAVHRKGNWGALLAVKPDILCIQETKSHPEQLDEDVRNPKGYHSFFNSSDLKKGYSGVAIYTKEKPVKVEDSLGEERFDVEGRFLGIHFKDFALFNAYFPNGGQGQHRIDYKLDFYDAFLARIEDVRKTQPNIFFCGDVNTAHEEIDLARPKENKDTTGFLPEERAWLDEVERHGYIDTYRSFYPEKEGAYTYWDMKTAARERNVGWRIDYFFASKEAEKKITRAAIHTDIFGSDHCPISIEIK